MLTIKRIVGEDFMAYHRLDVDLTSRTGITLIEGTRGSGRSNGSGKSTVFELLLWTLFGRTSRKLASVEKVMRRGMDPKDRTVGTVYLDLDGREIVVERTRGPQGPSFRVHGLDGNATNAGVHLLLERTIDYDYHRFTSSVMFTGQVSSFCRLPDASRKELLERMVGVDSYHTAEEVAKKRLVEVNAKLAVIANEHAGLSARVDTYRERLQRARTARLVTLARIVSDRRVLRGRSVKLLRAANEAADAYATWSREAALRQQELDAKAKACLAACDAASDKVDAAQAAWAAHEAKCAVARAKVDEIKDDLESHETGTHPDICPTCGQRWAQDQSKAAVQERVALVQKRLQEAELVLAPMVARGTELDAVCKAAKAARRAATDAYDAARRALSAGGTSDRTYLTKAIEAEHALRTAQEELVDLETGFDREAVDTELEEAFEALDQAQTALATCQAQHEVLSTQARRLAFWSKGFGRSGLPSFLVDSAIPAMNEVVSEVASALTDGELTVSFDPAAAKGRGDVFAVRVDYADGGDGYDSSSTGEQTRVDVAVLFALRDLAARRSRHPCTQLFLDEVMDGTDQAFAESFMRMLRSRYRDSSVFLISHDDSIKSLCDGALLVRKQGAVSTVS